MSNSQWPPFFFTCSRSLKYSNLFSRRQHRLNRLSLFNRLLWFFFHFRLFLRVLRSHNEKLRLIFRNPPPFPTLASPCLCERVDNDIWHKSQLLSFKKSEREYNVNMWICVLWTNVEYILSVYTIWRVMLKCSRNGYIYIVRLMYCE